ncbi:MAG: Fe-S cluster assembly protein SufB, partial [Candidatus Tectimicrobiota bacterium]
MSAEAASQLPVDLVTGDYKYGFHEPDISVFRSRKGIDREVVEEISWIKEEPDWMRQMRLEALEIFFAKPTPTWGGDIGQLNFDDIYYYVRPTDEQGQSWDDVPEEIKRTFDRLGIPEAEQKYLAGVGAQYDSEVVYHSLKKELADQGVIFLDMDSRL